MMTLNEIALGFPLKDKRNPQEQRRGCAFLRLVLAYSAFQGGNVHVTRDQLMHAAQEGRGFDDLEEGVREINNELKEYNELPKQNRIFY